MRIALCDDDPRDLELLRSSLLGYDPSCELECFSDARSLLAETKPFDIAVLDIEMPGLSGFDAALELQKRAVKPLVLFLTNSMAYTLRGYGVAFRYLAKPVDDQHLHAALDAAVREVKANRFVFTMEGCSHVVGMDDIYYLEIFNHHTVLHTQDREYTFRATLKEVLAQLPAGYFGMPHQSYVLNFSHVKTATSRDIHMTNGVSIPVSRRRQKDFMVQFYGYLGR